VIISAERVIKEIEGYTPFVKALKIFFLWKNATIMLMIIIKKSGSHDLKLLFTL